MNLLANLTPRGMGSRILPTGIDPAAAAFFAAQVAAGQTLSATEKTAVNGLVIALKSAGIWTNFNGLFIYPYVGGTATSTKFNLVNPATFPITWHGTPGFSANGVAGNGTDAYGDTGLTMSTVLSLTAMGCGEYFHLLPASGQSFLSDYDGTADFGVQADAGQAFYDATYPTRLTYTGSVTRMVSLSRLSSSSFNGYMNGASVVSTSSSAAALSTITIRLFTLGSAGGFSTETKAFSGVYQPMTDPQEAALYAAVQAFEVALGRAAFTYPGIIFDGDSITSGFGLSDPATQSWAAQAFALLSGKNDYRNVAISAQTLVDMTTGISDATRNLSSLRTKNIVCSGSSGTNDIYFGASAATAYSNLQAYVSAIKSALASTKVVVGTILPRSDSAPVGFEASRLTYNTSLRNDHSFADGLIDFAGIPGMGAIADLSGPNYQSGSGVHPSAAGAALMAALGAPVLASLL